MPGGAGTTGRSHDPVGFGPEREPAPKNGSNQCGPNLRRSTRLRLAEDGRSATVEPTLARIAEPPLVGVRRRATGNDSLRKRAETVREEDPMPNKRPSVKNEKQYETLKDRGMSKERAARIANSPGASRRGGKASGKGGSSKQGGTTAQKRAAGRQGGRATARKK